MLLRYLPSLHLETQLTFLITLLLWLMVGFYERPTVAAGRAHRRRRPALASLTKAVALLYPPLFVVGIVLACGRGTAARRGPADPVEAARSPSSSPSA